MENPTTVFGTQAQFGMWSYDVGSDSLLVSDGVWRVFGRDAGGDPLTLDAVRRWIREDYRAAFDAMLSDLLRSGTDDRIDDSVYPVVTPAGETRWVEFFLEARVDERGNVTELIGVSVDITHRVHGRYETDGFFDISIDLCAVAGMDGWFLQINNAWKEVLGWELQELTSRRFLDFVHPDDVAATEEAIEIQRNGGSIARFENRYRSKDGVYHWLEWTSAPDGRGTIFAIARDKTAEKQLQIERDRFFSLSIDLLVVAGTDGRFKKVNERWRELLGWEESEMVSRPFFDFVHPDDIESTADELERQKDGRRAIRFENRYRCKDGSYRWLEWTSQPEPDGTIYAIARDVTDRRSFERELVAARREAENANLAKSRFLAGMSHDLRTPLNAILGFSDLIRQETFGPVNNPHYQEYIDDIYNSGHLLISLINDILDLSKIEAGKYDLQEAELDIGNIIVQSVRQLDGMARRGSIRLDTEIPEVFPKMIGDERALIQILNNLLSNAIKFTEPGGSVKITAELGNDKCIMVRVIDTGIGMSEDDIIKALAPFEQTNAAQSRPNNHGTGLGLHLSANLMKIFGGSLEFESEVSNGTTVVLTFPASRTKRI